MCTAQVSGDEELARPVTSPRGPRSKDAGERNDRWDRARVHGDHQYDHQDRHDDHYDTGRPEEGQPGDHVRLPQTHQENMRRPAGTPADNQESTRRVPGESRRFRRPRTPGDRRNKIFFPSSSKIQSDSGALPKCFTGVGLSACAVRAS